MQLAAILLTLAALGGITMVVIRLKGAPLPPTGLATAHGAIAGIGVIVLAYNAYNPGIPSSRRSRWASSSWPPWAE
jgi:hypothetical protein